MNVDAGDYEYLDSHEAVTFNEIDSEFQQKVLLWFARHRIVGVVVGGVLLIVVKTIEILREKGGSRD